MKQKVTLQSLANELKISKSTVSRAFSRPELLDENTVKKIIDIAIKRKYRPNVSAKNLAMGKSRIFALLLPELNYIFGDFLSKILYGIELELDKAGSSIILSSYASEQRTDSIFSKLLNRADIAGAVVFGKSFSDSQLKEMSSPPVPAVAVDIQSDSFPCVYSDNFKLGRDLAEYLVKMGHTKIALMPGEAGWENAVSRKNGIISCLESHDIRIDVEQIMPCRFNYGFLDATTRFPELIKSINPSEFPTALIAGNDEIAAGIYVAARKMGISVPDDISVIGCDNNFFCDYLFPALTSVEQNGCEMGMRAAQMLTGVLQLQKYVCAHSIVIRQSVYPMSLKV